MFIVRVEIIKKNRFIISLSLNEKEKLLGK